MSSARLDTGDLCMEDQAGDDGTPGGRSYFQWVVSVLLGLAEIITLRLCTNRAVFVHVCKGFVEGALENKNQGIQGVLHLHLEHHAMEATIN